MIYIVSRHHGAIEWIRQALEKENISTNSQAQEIKQLTHFTPETIQWGDTVIGLLPINLIAQINALGGQYGHLSMDLKESDRGKELTIHDMNALNARIEWFSAIKTDHINANGISLFKSFLKDWDVDLKDRQSYPISINRSSNAIDVSFGNGEDKTPNLSLFIEVNKGVPAIHISDTFYGDMQLHLHATQDGLYISPETNTPLEPADKNHFTYNQSNSLFIKRSDLEHAEEMDQQNEYKSNEQNNPSSSA